MDAALAVGFVEAKQIENKAADDGEIDAGIFDTGAHLVVIQGDIETSVDLILDAPMSPHHIGQFAGVRGDTGDVEATHSYRVACESGLQVSRKLACCPSTRAQCCWWQYRSSPR